MTTGSGAKRLRWGSVVRYALAGALGVVAVVAAVKGLPWYLIAFVPVITSFVVLGRRRILRAAVTRTADGEIVCRFVPWFEGDAYLVNIAIPLLGVAALGFGFAPGEPVWLRFVGFLLVGLVPLFVYGTYRRWRLSLVRITPSALALRVPTSRKQEPTTIARERVVSITLKTRYTSGGLPVLQVEVTYHRTDSTADTATSMLLGQDLTVQPTNLYRALTTWHDTTGAAPPALMDRIERTLRAGSKVHV
jgi:hypothetical protein